MKKPTKLTDDEILSECRYQSSQASGSEFASDELTESRKNALRYYLGRARGDEVDGRSAVQSLDVADTVDSIITQIMPTFSGDNIVQFEPTSEQDEQQAMLESNFCNYQVMEKNNGFILFETLLKDALLSKNAVAKVFVDIKEDVVKEKYKGLTPEEMMMVLQPTKPNQEVITTIFNEDDGNISLERVTTIRKLCVEAVAPENFSITSEHKSQDLEECTYCVERSWRTKSDLIEMGYDAATVHELPISTSDTKIDSIERNQINDEQNFFNRELSMQICEIEEHYIRIDQDADGIAELHKVVTVENILLSNEEVECVPFANGVAFLMGHRFYGLSVYDKIKDIQDMKTHFLRQWSDNALIGNHKKMAVDTDNVNMDDLMNGRPNAVVRVNGLPANSIMEMPTNDIGPSCQMALDYYDKVRTDRTGSTLDLQSNQMSMPSNVGDQGVNTLVANLELVTANITRNFSETLVAGVYKLVHRYLRLYFQEELSAKMGGQWATTVPSQWRERDQINITVPPTATEKVKQQIAIEKAIMQATGEMQMGKDGIMTSDTNIYQMKIAHMRMSGIDHPEQYLIDPSSPQAQQVKQQQQQQQQMMQQQQIQMQMEQQRKQEELQYEMIQTQIAEIKRNWENDKEQLVFDREKLVRELMMDKYKIDIEAELKEAQLIGDINTKIEVESMKTQSKFIQDVAGKNSGGETDDDGNTESDTDD